MGIEIRLADYRDELTRRRRQLESVWTFVNDGHGGLSL
jgi:hypothetical protein